MDSLNGFVVFVQVAETRSFVAAGRLLGVSASAVGKSVARLEEKLGVRLFHRSTRSVTLTAEGTLFLERSRRILAEIEAAELELSHCEVRAPISGRVSRALTTPGNYVTAGVTVLTTLVTAAPVHVYVDIDENSLLKLQSLRREDRLYTNGQGRVPVEVQLSNEEGFRHRGHVESFDNRLNPATGSMVVRCEFANEDGILTPGLFARVRLPMTAKYPALLIDEKALLTDQANKYVLGVEEKDGGLVSVYKPVVIGPVIDGRRIIRSGLKAGERIIINGMARLPQPGMPVAPAEPEAKASAQAASGK